MSVIRKSVPLSTGWRYKSTSTPSDSPASSWQPSRPLPTEIHLDLLANGVIPDPFVGKNEESVQWVGDQTWVYETYFELPPEFSASQHSRLALVFEGLDTYATVKLNDREILQSDNMFVSHRVEVAEDHLLKGDEGFGRQHLQISFEPADQVGKQEVAKHPDHPWATFNPYISRLATRKAQYHYVSVCLGSI